MPPALNLYFLGPPKIELNNQPIALDRRKMVALLAFLYIEREPHQRASLSALLWPDYEQTKAYKNLRQVLWEIQRTLGTHWFEIDREKIGISDQADPWLDVKKFNSLIEKSRTEADISLRTALLAESAQLYRGHFLTGFSLKDAHPFNDWAFSISEELKNKLSHGLVTLSADYCTLGYADRAIPVARRLVSLDPLNESSHRTLMEVYIEAGQPNAAIKQYQTLEHILRQEWNLDPQPETRHLYKKIRKGNEVHVKSVSEDRTPPPLHNLPYPVSKFIGREKEQQEIKNLIAKNRLVTLSGSGGIGKTSLSLLLGHALINEFSNGVWFISLDSLFDPTLIIQTVASIFNVRESTSRPLNDGVIAALQGKQLLLILDNCEHLLDACAQLINTLLLHCPDLKVLATSREALGISGEVIFTMPSLPVPEPGVTTLEKITEYASIKLFLARAANASNSFQLTGENIQTIVDICRSLDGIPLAIELAAARVNILSTEEILRQLKNSFSVLARDGRMIMPRHQTLRASIEWDWGLLNEAEQVFLVQLSVFEGGWTLGSAQAVCDGDALDLIGAGVKKSLMRVSQAEGHETRYRFHEMIRQFLREKLDTSTLAEEIHTRHMKYFLDISKKAEGELNGSSSAHWMDLLDDERNNLRAALHYADKTDVEAGLYISGRLLRFWESINIPEGIRWLNLFLLKHEASGHLHARACALHAYGWLLTWFQKFDEAHAATEECLTLYRQLGDSAGEIDALISLGNIFQFKDDLKTADEIEKMALEKARSLGDVWREAKALNFIGWGYSEPGLKFSYWKEAIRLYRITGDQTELANLLAVFGQFKVTHGEIEEGDAYLDEAQQLWRSNKKANIWENVKIAKSLIELINGRYDEAKRLLREVLISAERSGSRMGGLWAQTRLGHVAYRAGDLTEARQLLTDAALQFANDGYTVGAFVALESLAGVFSASGYPAQTAKIIGFADAARERVLDTRPAIEQAEVDALVVASIAAMGKDAYLKAYEEGRNMNLEETIKLVQKQVK